MDREKYLILLNGQDKTDSVKEFRPCGDSCDIIYTSSPQVYHYYQGSKVKILELQQRIDSTGLIVTVKGVRMTQVDAILDFGLFYRIVRAGRRALSYPREDVEIQRNCLADQNAFPPRDRYLPLWPESEPESRGRKRAVLSNQRHPGPARRR